MITVKSLKNQELIADKCSVAESFLVRLKGLIGKTRFEPGCGMLFPNCNNIHMWFMSIPIDVVFAQTVSVSEASRSRVIRVTQVCESVRPWALFPLSCREASDTLELPEGTIRRFEIREGDDLCLSS